MGRRIDPMRTWAILAVCLATGLSAEAATFVRLQSQPGDPTLDGAQRLEIFDTPNISYTVTVTPNAAGGVDWIRAQKCVSTVCSPSSDSTVVQLAPAAGQAFATGTYASVQRYSNAAGSKPGLLADTQGRNNNRCPSVTGSFVVLEIARASDGTVLRFAADFEQHCNGEAPALYGGVRFNSDVPYTQPVPYVPATLRFSSETGDLIGGGQPGAFVVLDGKTSTSPPASGITFVGMSDGTNSWTVALTSGTPDRLIAGRYLNATAPGVPSNQPTVYVAYNGSTCSSYSGATFFIHEIEYSPQDFLVRLAADITIQCSGAPGAFHGGVRFNSKVPYISPPDGPTATGNLLPGGATLTVSLASSVSTCGFSEASFPDLAATIPPTPAPQRVAFPYGLVEFRADNCGTGTQTPVNVDFPDLLPPTAQWWIFGPTFDNGTPHWYPIPSAVSGNRISFTITDGDRGDVELVANGTVRSLGMLVVPGGVQQDLWWAGLGENGWGMSIVQHRDILFGNIFAYDSNGAATWYVMPSGTWDASHTVYTGGLYWPKGSPYFAYDVRGFDVGAAVGTARLTFSDANHAAFDLTINGIGMHKDLTRLGFGPQAPPTDTPLGDLWWAGIAQNGWGIALLQQFSSLFGLWFTYDAAGKPTWFVMPAGDWIQKGDYRGKLYRVVGPPWLGVPYDVSRHQTIEAGTFRFSFSGDGATFDYSVDGRTGSIPLSRIPF